RRTLAFSDVEREAHPAIDAVAERSCADGDPDALAILAGVLHFDRGDRAVGPQLCQRLLAALQILRRRNVSPREAMAFQMLSRVSEQPQECVVRLDEDVVLQNGDADDVRLYEAAPACLALQEPALRAVKAQQHADRGHELLRLQRLRQVD